MKDDQETYFAPAARLPLEEIEREAALFTDPLVAKLVNAVINGVVILNKHRQVVYANDNLLKLLGVESAAPLLGRRPGEIFACEHARVAPNGCGTCESCRYCGAVKTILASLDGHEAEDECRITQVVGGEISALDLRVRGTPFVVQGQPFSIFAIQDISHEKRRRSLERIFFHDIMNIVGGLRSLVELLHDQAPATLKDDVDMIYRFFNVLIEEIHSHRLLLGAENQDLELRPQLVDAKALLKTTVSIYSSHEVAKNRSIVLDPACEEVFLSTDLTLLRRVLGNLVKNALEASQENGVVTLGCGFAAHEFTPATPFLASALFRVHNQTEMRLDTQMQVFKRSFSTKGVDRGLGTYSVRLLTERYLGGKVSFVSSKEVGTTFWVALPLEIQAPDSPEQPPAATEIAG